MSSSSAKNSRLEVHLLLTYFIQFVLFLQGKPGRDIEFYSLQLFSVTQLLEIKIGEGEAGGRDLVLPALTDLLSMSEESLALMKNKARQFLADGTIARGEEEEAVRMEEVEGSLELRISTLDKKVEQNAAILGELLPLVRELRELRQSLNVTFCKHDEILQSS